MNTESEQYYFFENLKIVEKNLRELNCFYFKVSYTLKQFFRGLVVGSCLHLTSVK